MGDVDYILDTPSAMWVHLNTLHPDATARRTAAMEYYLQNSPHVSWEWLAGRCLFEEKDSALQAVKAWIRPDKGMEICMAGTLSYVDD